MRYLRPLIVLVALSSASASLAQSDTYTSEDEALLQQCFAGVAEAGEVDAGGGVSLLDCIGAASNVCQEEDPSTQGIVACNSREQSWWDEQLNDHYATLKAGLQADIFGSLQKAQRAWLAYRDANCDYQYQLWGDGTMRQVIGSYCWMEMTAQRAIDLSYDLDAISL